MTFTENVMRRLFEKSPELKDTTFCGRTLIAKVDSQIIYLGNIPFLTCFLRNARTFQPEVERL